MSHRPNRQAELHVEQLGEGTRNDPIRVEAHFNKMKGKFFRNQERDIGHYAKQLAAGARIRLNVSRKVK